MTSENLFILAGNGPYENRGCEAIVRGTVEIIRRHFEAPTFVVCSHFASESQQKAQIKAEYDPRILHLGVRPLSPAKKRLYGCLPKRRGEHLYRELAPWLPRAQQILSVGGDNYSLDYGIPQVFTDFDDFVERQGRKTVIWGASVGPFRGIPRYERFMAKHLRKTLIFARESLTVEYLRGLGLTDNIFPTVDPAFAMPSKEPSDAERYRNLPETLGINLSPLLARYVTGRDEILWLRKATEIVERIREHFQCPILLIPHVMESNSDDHAFLCRIREALGYGVEVIPAHYGAAELKWIISRTRAFAGARTHSTIAALSSGVPTASFAYSVKAEGLNQDLYGDLAFCIPPSELSPERAVSTLSTLLEKEQAVRGLLQERVQPMIERAFESGARLKSL